MVVDDHTAGGQGGERDRRQDADGAGGEDGL
jgi:hypothetical protein